MMSPCTEVFPRWTNMSKTLRTATFPSSLTKFAPLNCKAFLADTIPLVNCLIFPCSDNTVLKLTDYINEVSERKQEYDVMQSLIDKIENNLKFEKTKLTLSTSKKEFSEPIPAKTFEASRLILSQFKVFNFDVCFWGGHSTDNPNHISFFVGLWRESPNIDGTEWKFKRIYWLPWEARHDIYEKQWHCVCLLHSKRILQWVWDIPGQFAAVQGQWRFQRFHVLTWECHWLQHQCHKVRLAIDGV